MDLTKKQALYKGIEAHKNGHKEEAERYYTAILNAEPKHADANHNMGVLLLGIGKVKDALPFFKTALDANKNSAQFWLSYINALIKLNRLTDAKLIYDQAKSCGAKGDSFDKLEQLLLANIQSNSHLKKKKIINKAVFLKESGNTDQAITLLKNLVRQFPEDPQLYALLAECFILIDKLDEASSYLDSAKKLDSENALLGLNEARLFLKQGKIDQAVLSANKTNTLFPNEFERLAILSSCSRAHGDLAESLKYLNKAIELNPNYVEALINRSQIWLEQGKKEDALIDLELAHKIKPHLKQIWKLLVALIVDTKNFSKAISTLINMIDIDPTYEENFSTIAICNQMANDPSLAVISFEKVLEIRPDDAAAHLNLAIALRLLGKNKNAIEHSKIAISIKPDFSEAYDNLGHVLRIQRKLPEAIEAYTNAIAIEPNSPMTQNALGVSLQEQGKIEEAIKSYKKAISIKPDYAEAYNNLGNALSSENKLEKALNNFEKALKLNNNYAHAYNNMGLVLKKQGKIKKAIRAYNKSIEIKRDYSEAYNNKGEALYEIGQLEDAIISFSKAISIQPSVAKYWDNIFFPMQAIEPETSIDEDLHISIQRNKSDNEKILQSILNYRLHRGEEGTGIFFDKALHSLSNSTNASIHNPTFSNNQFKQKNNLFSKVVALTHFGRSGTGLLHSLIDSHPEVSTLPSIYFSEYFDQSTWERITSDGWDQMVDRFIQIYEVLFNASSINPIEGRSKKLLYNIGIKEGMANVGNDQNEVLKVDKPFFVKELNQLISCYSEMDQLLFFKLAHVAYERAIENVCSKDLIFYHIHNPDTHALLNFSRFVPQAKFMMMVREPIQSCESWVRGNYEIKDYFGVTLRILTMLYEVDNVVYTRHNSIGVRLEDLKRRPRKTRPAICKWMGISENDGMYSMTAQGRKWWGDPNSPDYLEDGMNPFGKTSINRRVGTIFSENDQFILKTLFYPFRLNFGYTNDSLEKFKDDLKKIKPMLEGMFDFERRLLQNTDGDHQQFEKSGAYLHFRSGLMKRWNTLNKFHTYPNMVLKLKV